MEKYIINNLTLAIIIKNNQTEIIEQYGKYNTQILPTEIINTSCKYYGSSLIGRCEGSNYLIGIKYKCPIIISETKKIVFFPTKTIKDSSCCWINVDAVKKYVYDTHKKCLILTLLNNEIIELNMTSYSFSNQYLKSTRLLNIIKSKNY